MLTAVSSFVQNTISTTEGQIAGGWRQCVERENQQGSAPSQWSQFAGSMRRYQTVLRDLAFAHLRPPTHSLTRSPLSHHRRHCQHRHKHQHHQQQHFKQSAHRPQPNFIARGLGAVGVDGCIWDGRREESHKHQHQHQHKHKH